MTRRELRRTTGSEPRVRPGVFCGLSGFQSGLLLATTASQGVQGSTLGFWAAQLIRIDSQVGSATRISFNAFQGASGNGWDFRTLTTNATLLFEAFFGAGTGFNSPTRAIAASDVGKLALCVGVFDVAASRLRLYINGAEVGSGTATVGAYRPPVAGATAFGGRADGGNLPSDNTTIFGCCGGDGFTPTAKEIEVQYLSTVDSGAIQPIPAKTTNRWVFPNTWNAPVTLIDSTGGDTASVTAGAASSFVLRQLENPVWL